MIYKYFHSESMNQSRAHRNIRAIIHVRIHIHVFVVYMCGTCTCIVLHMLDMNDVGDHTVCYQNI